MAVNHTSDAKKRAIIGKSISALPDNPTDYGYTAQQIKNAMFAKPATEGDNSIIGEINRVVDEVNEELGGKVAKETEIAGVPVGDGISKHDLLEALGGGEVIVVDDELSETSENPVQNKVITAKIDQLVDIIGEVSQIGRYLSSWDCTTGLPGTEPVSGTPYFYHRGDYFIVSAVGSTNYVPNGQYYNGEASTVTTAEEIHAFDMYRYDGEVWSVLPLHLAFEGVINAKLDKVTSGSNQVYAIDSYGEQTMVSYSSQPTGGTVALRSSGGTLQVGTPTSPQHAATKGYVDSATSGVFPAAPTKKSVLVYDVSKSSTPITESACTGFYFDTEEMRSIDWATFYASLSGSGERKFIADYQSGGAYFYIAVYHPQNDYADLYGFEWESSLGTGTHSILYNAGDTYYDELGPGDVGYFNAGVQYEFGYIHGDFHLDLSEDIETTITLSNVTASLANAVADLVSMNNPFVRSSEGTKWEEPERETQVTVGGVAQDTWDADTKVDKSSSARVLYGTDTFGKQDELAYTNGVTPNTIVMRDSAGRFRAQSPSIDTDVATKQYADAARGNTGTLTVSASGWSSGVKTVSLSSLTSDKVIFLYPADLASKQAADSANLFVSAGNKSLTFTALGTVPTVSLTFKYHIKHGGTAV